VIYNKNYVNTVAGQSEVSFQYLAQVMNGPVLLLLSKKLAWLLLPTIWVWQILWNFSFQEEVVYTVEKKWRKNILTH